MPKSIASKRESSSSMTEMDSFMLSSEFMTEVPNSPYSPFSPLQNRSERSCLRSLKNFCLCSSIHIPDDLIFRFACFHSFDFAEAKAAIRQDYASHYLRLQMRGALLKQFDTNTLFPLPGLKTKKRESEAIYLRPSRFFPEKTDPEAVLESLCYVLNDLSDTIEKCRNGVAMIVNMKGFTTKNYEERYWVHLMRAMQGHLVPTTVKLLLFVNPPTWFGKVWKSMKSILSNSFVKRVHVIDSEDLGHYLMDGFQAFLPEELAQGWRNASEIVEDYTDLKIFQDKEKAVQRRSSLGVNVPMLPEVPIKQ